MSSTITATPAYPSVPDMITSHTLAHNIITRHNTPNDVLDDTELSLLHRFTTDPTSTSLSSSIPNTNTTSLVQSIISHHNTSNPLLTPHELTLLSQFFSSLSIDLSSDPVANMMRTRTLAYNLILRPFEIFSQDGSEEFAIMRDLCGLTDPSDLAARKKILKNYDLLDDGVDVNLDDDDDDDDNNNNNNDDNTVVGVAVPSKILYGQKAKKKGSLAAYCVATFGEEEGGQKSAISDEEIKVLGEWFRNGGPVF